MSLVDFLADESTYPKGLGADALSSVLTVKQILAARGPTRWMSCPRLVCIYRVDMIADRSAAPRDYGSDFAAGGGLGARGGRSRFDDGPGFARAEPPLPTEPPFTAFVVNLSFESTEADVEHFFEPLKPVSIRLVSGHDGRPKGYGYVEFETLDILKEALTFTGKPMDNRNVRVSVAEPSSRSMKGAMADEATQWRRSTPLAADNRGGPFGGGPSGGSSGFDEMGVGSDGTRSGFGGKFVPTADRPRRGGIEPAEPGRGDTASDWRTGKPVSGKSSSRFGFGGDSERRGGDRPGAADEGFANWRAGRQASAESATGERRKLDLKPRSTTASSTSATSQSSARSNPFGSAKPVDVGQREREIDEKIREQDRIRREERLKEDERKKSRASKAPSDGAWLAKAEKPAKTAEAPAEENKETTA